MGVEEGVDVELEGGEHVLGLGGGGGVGGHDGGYVCGSG